MQYILIIKMVISLCLILLALGIGLAFGLVQGFLVAYLDIQPFIVSLAGMFFARGMTTIVHTNPFNVENEAFVALKGTRITVPGLGSVQSSWKICRCLCKYRCNSSSFDSSDFILCASLDKAWT